MESQTKEQSVFSSLFRVGLFYFVGLSLFFIAGFIVISLRVSKKDKVEVPVLAGNLYLDEHNRLTDMGFHVSLDKIYTNEYKDGTILAQSIPAGKVVKDGARLNLLLAEGDPIIEVPNVVGMALNLAKKQIAEIPRGAHVFSLAEGIITTIPSEKPKGEVLAQNPPAGARVIPGSPISMLVSDGPQKLKYSMRLEKMEGAPVGIIKALAYELKVPVELEVKETGNPNEHGNVISSEFNTDKKSTWEKAENTSWKVVVGRYNPEEKLFFKGKKEYAHDEFPFRVVFIKSDDYHLKGKTITVARKTTASRNQEAAYSEYSYVKVGEYLPVYKLSEDDLSWWEGHYETTDAFFESEQPIGEEGVPSDAEAVFQEEPESEKQAVSGPEEHSIHLSSISI